MQPSATGCVSMLRLLDDPWVYSRREAVAVTEIAGNGVNGGPAVRGVVAVAHAAERPAPAFPQATMSRAARGRGLARFLTRARLLLVCFLSVVHRAVACEPPHCWLSS